MAEMKMKKGKSKTPKGGAKGGAKIRDPGGATEKKLKKGKK